MSPAVAFVDWGLAERTAAAIAGNPDRVTPGYRPAEVARASEEAIVLAARYARMGLPDRPPVSELLDRRQWSQTALATLGAASAPLERRLAAGVSLPGPLGGAVRHVVGLGVGAEAGLAVGIAARRVLGQYDVDLFGTEREPRLLFVGPNLDRVRVELEADSDLFLRWVALHETTHVLQFTAVDWLAPHVRGLVAKLLDGAAAGMDPGRIGELARSLLRDPRALARSILRGELARMLADEESRAILDRTQATMAVIEGHAEHVMDACAADEPGLAALRAGLGRRRASRGGLGEVVARLLGFELKLRQYELGKKFWDAVVASRGETALEQVWSDPSSLPDLGELEDPQRWLERTAAPLTVR